MTEIKLLYVPIGVGTFDMEVAANQFKLSLSLLNRISNNVIYPEKVLLSTNEINNYIQNKIYDVVIVQNVCFANAAFISQVLRTLSTDIILWAIPEPIIDGGRLRLNSLTGAFSAGNAINGFGHHNFIFVYGAPDNKKTYDELLRVCKVIQLKEDMKKMKIASVGQTPEGFGFGRTLDIDLLNTFGVETVTVETRELMKRANEILDSKEGKNLELKETGNFDFSGINKNNVDKSEALFMAYKEFVDQNQIQALASRCWPDFFAEYKAPICMVLSILNDIGIPSACEADGYGALSMYIANKLSESHVFFGDPVSLDETNNTITYWHCGMSATKLAKNDKPTIGVHPNRKIGPVMDFITKPCDEVTVMRIGKSSDGKHRIYVSLGEAICAEKPFNGTSMIVKTNNNASEIIKKSVVDGWEPHFVVAYKNILEELKLFAKVFNIEIIEY